MAKADGREFGKAFEQIVQSRARSNGLLILKHELTGRYIGGGGVRLVKSELDFAIFSRQGQVAFFDAKTYGNPHFDYSELLAAKEPKDHQIQRALLYQDWNIPGGFLVWFRPIDQVSFYSGDTIARLGPGTRFTPEMGLRLGNVQSFDLRVILGVRRQEMAARSPEASSGADTAR